MLYVRMPGDSQRHMPRLTPLDVLGMDLSKNMVNQSENKPMNSSEPKPVERLDVDELNSLEAWLTASENIGSSIEENEAADDAWIELLDELGEPRKARKLMNMASESLTLRAEVQRLTAENNALREKVRVREEMLERVTHSQHGVSRYREKAYLLCDEDCIACAWERVKGGGK